MSRITDNAVRGAGQALLVMLFVWLVMFGGLAWAIYWFIDHARNLPKP